MQYTANKPRYKRMNVICCGCCYRGYIDIILLWYNPIYTNNIILYIILLWYNWLYGFIQGSFLSSITFMNSFHSFNSCMNSCYSFMCSYMVLWLLLSLDMIGMFHISYYTVIPMLYQRLHVVINHRQFFSWYSFSLVGYMVDLCFCVVGWPTI